MKSEQPASSATLPDIKDRLKLWRAGIALRPTQNLVYRFVVAVAGTVVLAVGIVAIPYPGPGWLIVFAGLGILASEFTWARRILHAVRIRYDRFMAWFSRQSWVVRGVAALGTGVVVLGTLWVLGAVALVGGWVGVDHPWLTSPL